MDLFSYFLQYELIRHSRSFLLISVDIKTSWAVWPFLAIALYPLIVLTDILMVKWDVLPLTLEIEAGVTVLICSLDANFFKTGIRPSI
tara:strand:- start:76 stop:339 length:264 start_codon:yes stop_codon:yes gene_type:complete